MMDIIGKSMELNGLIDYQDGSIVSKEIIRREKGTVTLFAFAEGQGLSEHTAPFDALVYIIEGIAEAVISGQPRTLRGGEIIIMPAGKPHSLRALNRFKMLLIMIRSS